MERFTVFILTVFLTQAAWANNQEAKSDVAWSDIGDSVFQVEEEPKVQRDYDSISADEGLMPVGSFIKLVQDVNLRTSPGGIKIKPILKDEDFQVLEVVVDSSGKRYYKIKAGQDVGYIYAGTKVSYGDWTQQTWSSNNKVIAEPGDLVKVKRKKGLKISKKINEDSFYRVPKNSEVLVESVIQDQTGKLFYKVKYKSRSGYASVAGPEQIAQVKDWKEVY
jgi:hypothetical protein